MITYWITCVCERGIKVTFKRQNKKGRLCECGRWIQVTRDDGGVIAAAYLENDPEGVGVVVREASQIEELTLELEVDRRRY